MKITADNQVNLRTVEIEDAEFLLQFKTQKQAIKHLEKVRWNKKPVCPYCSCVGATKVKESIRYHHCGACNKQFSVTVNTIFHDTRLPLQKWLLAIAIITNAKKDISSRELARQLDVNKDTAWRMQMKIREAIQDKEQATLFTGIVECDEYYIGGKKKKGDKNRRSSSDKKDDNDDFTNKRGLAQINKESLERLSVKVAK